MSEVVEELLTVREVMTRLKVSRATLYRERERGHLRAIPLSDGPKAPIRFTVSDVNQMIERWRSNGRGSR